MVYPTGASIVILKELTRPKNLPERLVDPDDACVPSFLG